VRAVNGVTSIAPVEEASATAWRDALKPVVFLGPTWCVGRVTSMTPSGSRPLDDAQIGGTFVLWKVCPVPLTSVLVCSDVCLGR
jgi:hypothetical protein